MNIYYTVSLQRNKSQSKCKNCCFFWDWTSSCSCQNSWQEQESVRWLLLTVFFLKDRMIDMAGKLCPCFHSIAHCAVTTLQHEYSPVEKRAAHRWSRPVSGFLKRRLKASEGSCECKLLPIRNVLNSVLKEERVSWFHKARPDNARLCFPLYL